MYFMGADEKKKIEFVSTGNSGRSPVAELIGRNHLKSLELDDRLDTISSGIWVADMKLGAVPEDLGIVAGIVDKALVRGDFYNGDEIVEVVKFVVNPSVQTYDTKFNWFGRAVETFMREEREFRAEALKKFNISGEVKKGHDQTVSREGVPAIFGMESKQVLFCQGLYSGKDRKPLSILELGISDGTFGSGREKYFAMVEKMMPLVPKAIDRFLEIHRSQLGL